MCAVVREALEAFGYEVAAARSGAEALELVRRRLFDAALLDIRMPGMDGLALLREIKRLDPALQVAMITGYPEVATAVEALKQGARDYLTKPFPAERLGLLVAQLVAGGSPRRPPASPPGPLGAPPPARELVAVSPLMERVKAMAAAVAPTDSPVLIEGESGTGKELVAALIHRLSLRNEGPFIPVNCSAIPSELLESELFGHVRGAFSGAVADALGLFRSASGGTLFLDEVAELPPPLQVKLLRFLQDGEIRPVGSAKTYRVDVRVIAASNRRLDEAIRDGTLRQDLFYRLNVVRIALPPLRERKEAIPALVAHFLRRLNQRFGRQVKGVAPDAMAALLAYDFPGNVRELENLLERAFALGAREEIGLADLPTLPATPVADGPRAAPLPTLPEAERALILRALRACGNNRDQAARALGIPRRTFYRRLKKYGLL